MNPIVIAYNIKNIHVGNLFPSALYLVTESANPIIVNIPSIVTISLIASIYSFTPFIYFLFPFWEFIYSLLPFLFWRIFLGLTRSDFRNCSNPYPLSSFCVFRFCLSGAGALPRPPMLSLSFFVCVLQCNKLIYNYSQNNRFAKSLKCFKTALNPFIYGLFGNLLSPARLSNLRNVKIYQSFAGNSGIAATSPPYAVAICSAVLLVNLLGSVCAFCWLQPW